ncbi:MAG: S41 family peptidase [Clostridia bacterium]|nr:S41 family peptidase [Clostridia bacterium]
MNKQLSVKYALFYGVIAVAVAISMTIGIMMLVFNFEKAELEKEFQKDLESAYEGAEELSSIIEYYNTLPEEQRNYDMYLKLCELEKWYRTYYVKADEMDNDTITHMVANGFIAGVGDKHGEYYTVDDFYALTSQTQGNTVGIGVYVRLDPETQCIKVLTVMKDSPALEAGVMAGDLIVKVDGQSVTELGYYEAINRVAGKEGTNVELTIQRAGNELTLVATRRKVETETVYYHKYESDPTVGVVRVIEFNESTTEQFKTAVNTLLNDEGCTSLVFDMRSNPGGTLNSVTQMLDFLLPKGDVVYVTNKDGVVLEKYVSDAECIDVPMAVLTDGNTASAAELFTCALRDYDKAVVVGTTTYGKGSVQSLIELEDGTGLRFTTYLYSPPKSENYDGVGIVPDVEVELDESLLNKNYFEITDAEDNQLRAAVDALK